MIAASFVRTLRVLLVVGSVTTSSAAWAQTPAPPPPEPPRLGPSNNSELGLVVASGNAKSTSVALRNVYVYRWPTSEFGWEMGWLRADSRDGDRFAVQTSSGFDVVEPDTQTDSQRLFSKLRYQRQLSARQDWFANFDAIRDEPSNINSQFVLAAGLGTTWRKSDRLTFRTAYGISYTDEDLVVEGSRHFGGYRLGYSLKGKPTTTTGVESELTFDGSFDEGDDIRTDWLNGLTVAMNSRMALKAGIRLLFRNEPALETLELRTPAGVVIGGVDVFKKKVDTNLTTSLVITF
jgi:hypothetical protein